LRQIILFTILSLFLFCPAILFATPVGTAPTPYPYAEHEDGFWQYLGADWEANDGISWTPFAPGQLAYIDITVNSEGEFEWLSLWIDWDQSGSWENNELMVDLQQVWFDVGATTLTEVITVPSSAILGTTWMRARFGFDGPYSPDGFAFYGEVEDYQVDVVPEPNTILLLASGLAGIAGYTGIRFRRKIVGGIAPYI